MARRQGTRPEDGIRPGRRAALAAAVLVATALPVAAQRLPYPAVPAEAAVLPEAAAPRIAYAAVPRDVALAEPFAYDDLTEPLPSEAEQQALAGRLNGQDYPPNPAIWKIADRDTTIYLFGTVHVLPPGFAWRNAGVDRIVGESDTLILESVGDGGVESLIGGVPGGPALPPLAARASLDHRAALAAFMADLPPEAARVMDGLPTWIAAVAVGFVRDYRAGEIPGPGADDWLEAEFRARGRRIDHIEDGGKVLARVNAVPESEQRRMLDAALDAAQPSRAALRAPLHAWAKGEIGPRSALRVDLERSSGSAALTGPLLTERNTAWAASLRRRLKAPGTMLFAAGAGHFVGRGSVIERLRAGGTRVTRVQ